MPTPEQLAAIELYRELMTENKFRIHVVDTATSNQFPVAPHFVKEICYLQFRMMCELIALGCLVSHGDLGAIKKGKLGNLWKVKDIIEEMGRLHKDFYPIAVKKERNASGFGIEPKTAQPLPKDDLLKLYAKCGDILHKGAAKKIISKKQPIQIHYPDMTAIAQRFRDHISDHMIIAPGANFVFLCEIFPQGANKETINVALAEPPSHTVS